jgi:Zn-dependent membrane protease YugP
VHFGEVVAVDKGLDVLQLIHDQQQINGVVLSVVCHEVGHDSVNHRNQLIIRLVVLQTQLVLSTDVAGEVAHVLMAPVSEICIGPLQQVIQTGPCSLLSEYHRQH